MTAKNFSPVAAKGDKAACADDCACPSNDNNSAAEKKPGFLRRVFGKSALCTCSGAGGFLIGHAGCIITPMVMAAVGITTATAGVSLLALSFGAAATAGGLYLWHKLRGQQASTFEKRLVIGSALSGLLISGAMMHLGGHEHHGNGHDHHPTTPTEQTVPPSHHQHHGHHHSQHDNSPANLSPAAAAWLVRQDAQTRETVARNAHTLGMPLGAYLNGMCGITPPPAPKPGM